MSKTQEPEELEKFEMENAKIKKVQEKEASTRSTLVTASARKSCLTPRASLVKKSYNLCVAWKNGTRDGALSCDERLETSIASCS